jgi:hypothetical protein
VAPRGAGPKASTAPSVTPSTTGVTVPTLRTAITDAAPLDAIPLGGIPADAGGLSRADGPLSSGAAERYPSGPAGPHAGRSLLPAWGGSAVAALGFTTLLSVAGLGAAAAVSRRRQPAC